MLYPKQTLQTLLNQYPELIEEIWLLLNAIPIKNLLKEGRVYGGGLYKIEPKELMRVSSNKLEKLSTLTIS